MPVTSRPLKWISRCAHSNKYEGGGECSNRWKWPERTDDETNSVVVVLLTCGESNGYWSLNLNCNWNFSPSYNVPGAPSMSMRILFDGPTSIRVQKGDSFDLPAHVRTIIDHSSKPMTMKTRPERAKERWCWLTCPAWDFLSRVSTLSLTVFEPNRTRTRGTVWWKRRRSSTYCHDENRLAVCWRSIKKWSSSKKQSIVVINSDHSFLFWKVISSSFVQKHEKKTETKILAIISLWFERHRLEMWGHIIHFRSGDCSTHWK